MVIHVSPPPPPSREAARTPGPAGWPCVDEVTHFYHTHLCVYNKYIYIYIDIMYVYIYIYIYIVAW